MFPHFTLAMSGLPACGVVVICSAHQTITFAGGLIVCGGRWRFRRFDVERTEYAPRRTTWLGPGPLTRKE